MADRVTYPSLPVRTWWDLRNRFQQSPPSKVDSDYLQSVLGVQEGHASNLMGPLTALGLIDEAGKPTDVAEDWRHDETYAQACKKIVEAVYPTALREALPPPGPDRGEVEKWFARNAHVGTGAAGKMATTYLLIAAADPAGASQKQPQRAAGATTGTPAARKPRRATPAAAGSTASKAGTTAEAAAGTANGGGNSDGPSVHVDVQVHISPDATADQIDAIFASMAKHLYAKRS